MRLLTGLAAMLGLGSLLACGTERAPASQQSVRRQPEGARCEARRIDVDTWPEVRAVRAPVRFRLPAPRTHLPVESRLVRGEFWATQGGYVSYVVEEWGSEWADSAAADLAPSKPLCFDSVSGQLVRVRAFFGRPHPFSQGQYVTVYYPLASGRVLILQAFGPDSQARDTLFAVVRSLRPE
jgi:hypothetical protein